MTTPAPNPVRSAPPQQQQLRQPRLSLSSVIKGKQKKPYRILKYGTAGIGKTTFAGSAPKPIFLDIERGSSRLDVARFPEPEGGFELSDIYDALRLLATEQHDFQTLVIDTLDHLEPLVWKTVIAEANRRSKDTVSSIEEVGGGFGKGYTAAVDEWRKLAAWLQRLQDAKGMHVIMLAHSHVKAFKNPMGPDFDRYQLKMNEKAGGFLKEWSDYVLFAKLEVLAHKEAKTRKVLGVSDGTRMIHTQETPAWDAKFRGEPGAVPAQFPLSWDEFVRIADGADVQQSPEQLRASITEAAQTLGGELEKQILETLKKAGSNMQSLVVIQNRVAAKLAEKEQQSNG